MIPQYLQQSSWSHEEKFSGLALTAPTMGESALKGAEGKIHTLSSWWIPPFSRKAVWCRADNTASRLYTISSISSYNSSSTQANPQQQVTLALAWAPCGSRAAVKLCLTLKTQFQALCPPRNTLKCSSEVQTTRTVWKKSPTLPRAHMISGGITVWQISRAKMSSAKC